MCGDAIHFYCLSVVSRAKSPAMYLCHLQIDHQYLFARSVFSAQSGDWGLGSLDGQLSQRVPSNPCPAPGQPCASTSLAPSCRCGPTASRGSFALLSLTSCGRCAQLAGGPCVRFFASASWYLFYSTLLPSLPFVYHAHPIQSVT